MSSNMRTKDVFVMAFKALATHKLRSALTMLGIVIGIASITLIMAVGNSAQNLILGEIQTLKPESVYVTPGRQPSGFSGALSTLFNDSLKNRDYEELSKKSNVPDAKEVVPLVPAYLPVTHESDVYHDAMILGISEKGKDLFNLNLASGNFFTSDDVNQKSDTIVIGAKISDKFFPFGGAVGQKVKIKNKNYRIVGVLSSKGQAVAFNFDEAVIIPYTTVQQYILGVRYFHHIIIEANSVNDIPHVIQDATTVLRQDHNITDPEKDDFYFQTQNDVIKTVGVVTNVFTFFLALVAAISLVVGGIGIMNIMLVSVTERTREIGIRKAVGATRQNILNQFLAEAVILTISGGILGVGCGFLFSWLATALINRFSDFYFQFTFPLSGTILGVAVSLIIGFVFGIVPAWQASQKSPVEALRYE